MSRSSTSRDDRYPDVNTKVGFEECWKLEGWFSCHHPYDKRVLVMSDPPVEHCRECDSTRPPTGKLRSYWPSVTKPQSEHPYLAPRAQYRPRHDDGDDKQEQPGRDV